MKFMIFTVFALLFVGAISQTIRVNEHNLEWAQLNWIDDQVAILLTEDSLVFKTSDTGINWVDITSQLDGANDPDYRPVYLYPSPVDPNMFYIRGSGNWNWISDDKGVTWEQVTSPTTLVNLDFHLSLPKSIIAIDIAGTVYYSNNFGRKWAPAADLVFSYTWGDAGQGEVPAYRIYVTQFELNSEHFADLKYTDDYGVTFTTVLTGGYDFIFAEKDIYAVAVSEDGSKATLRVSTDVGKNVKQFNEARFPFAGDLPEHAYTILDDHTGAVFLAINHSPISQDNYGNLYVSDATGTRYSVAMQNIHAENAFFDFHRVRSLEGIYLANKIKSINAPVRQVTSEITFSNGGHWVTLKAPHFDSNGQPIQCSGCSLHLHAWDAFYPNQELDSFSGLSSTNRAVGMIVANGNVGLSLTYDLLLLRTYLSRDAGVTWIEMAKGAHWIKILDHGGIIVLIPSSTSSGTTSLLYTLDQGLTMNTYFFTDTPISVKAVETDVANSREKLVLLGEREDGSKWVIGIDFSSVFSRTCTDSDYEAWGPSNDVEPCLLGHETMYLRRMQSATCFNNENINHILNDTACLCQEEDWECDLGFEYAADELTCLPDSPTDNNDGVPLICPVGTTYYETKGYRKEAGNKCIGGVDHSADGPFNCPGSDSTGGGSGKKGWIAAAVLIPLVILIILGVFAAMRSETLREKLPFLKFVDDWKVGYSGVNTGDNRLMEEEEEIEHEDFSIQAEEIEEDKLDNLGSSTSPKTTQKTSQNNNLISMDDDEPSKATSAPISFDDFNPRS